MHHNRLLPLLFRVVECLSLKKKTTQNCWHYGSVSAWAFSLCLLCGTSLMSLACLVIPSLDLSGFGIAIIPCSSRELLKMQWGVGGWEVFTSATMCWINTKDPSHESYQAPIINNKWANQQGYWASIVRWLNGRRDHQRGTIIQRYIGQLLRRWLWWSQWGWWWFEPWCCCRGLLWHFLTAGLEQEETCMCLQ